MVDDPRFLTSRAQTQSPTFARPVQPPFLIVTEMTACSFNQSEITGRRWQRAPQSGNRRRGRGSLSERDERFPLSMHWRLSISVMFSLWKVDSTVMIRFPEGNRIH